MSVSGNRVLRRSKEDFAFFGLCGGLGRFFGIDPGWFRVLVLLVPPLWLPYLVIGVMMPVERPGDELGPPTPRIQETSWSVSGNASRSEPVMDDPQRTRPRKTLRPPIWCG